LTEGQQIIDVERLVDELRGRVAQMRREGHYEDDLTRLPLPAVAHAVVPRLDVGATSSNPLLRRVKTVLLRLLWRMIADLARQTNAALSGSRAYAAEEVAAARDEAADEIANVRAEMSATAQELSRVRVDASDRAIVAEERIAKLELRLAELGAAGAVGSRLPAGPMEYAAFEDRYRPEAQVRERQQIYREALSGRRRVVDLGCGRGELLELLREAGVDCYGVEVDSHFVEHARGNGLEIVQQEAVAHLETIERGDVDTIVASHVIEHLPPTSFFRLIELGAEKLPDDGLMVFETPNPTSVLAGSVNFHRDPTHVHPIHPDTLAFLCRQAGFANVDMTPLVPVPPEERLPERAPGEGELASHVDSVVGQLNEFLYGHLDYALFARR
jgi:O-antigen chain-terminating methyltransferase